MAQTETLFRDGYFDTGDTGYMTPEKLLVITGRTKEVFNLGGDKVSPQAIENTITTFKGVHEAGAFTTLNELGIDEVWALIAHGDPLDEEALRKHCQAKLAQTHVPVRFISVAKLPRNANGKLERRGLSALAQGLVSSAG